KELEIFTVEGTERELRPAVNDAMAPIRRLKAAAAARGASLTVAIAPPWFALDAAEAADLFDLFGVPGTPALDEPAKLFAAALRAEGVAACDLTPALAASVARGDRPYFRYDGHWNATGHTVAADAIAGCVRNGAAAAR
ncbi:MAG: alginate O-acetyltransferase AlgX-related protein, partial [Myxococcota bacterium]